MLFAILLFAILWAFGWNATLPVAPRRFAGNESDEVGKADDKKKAKDKKKRKQTHAEDTDDGPGQKDADNTDGGPDKSDKEETQDTDVPKKRPSGKAGQVALNKI